jgi:hypothetical protein
MKFNLDIKQVGKNFEGKEPFRKLNDHAIEALNNIVMSNEQEGFDKLINKQMYHAKLIHRKNHWYLVDDRVTPIEGGVAIWCNIRPIFTNFIDEEKGVCSTNEKVFGMTTLGFNNLETVMGSTNSFDGTPMLDVSKFEELGVVHEYLDYPVDYTITFSNGNQEAYLINHFVNILRVKK